MIDLMDITDEELSAYFRRLIPRLQRRRPREWVPIASIANDPNRFMDIVVCMNNHRYFDDKEGFSMIEVSNDEKYIRIVPDNMERMRRGDESSRWKWEWIWDKK